jgi:hypothetical protein
VLTKKIHQHSFIGQKGVNLIEKITLDMGFLWYPSPAMEAGIDGIIEIRDSVTGEVTNSIIQVQSKATSTAFQAETDHGFDYLCDAKDLNYWMRGNAPVILIRSRPDTNEAYWVSIKDYFKDPERLKARKIHFDKHTDRFDAGCKAALMALAMPRDAGIYFAPVPKQETLYSNLLRVSNYADHIFTAQTSLLDRRDVRAAFERIGATVGDEWTVKAKTIYSFIDLDQEPWDKVCEAGTLEPFDARLWAYSDDPDKKRVFVELLNHCLRAKAKELNLVYSRGFSKKNEYYYFDATPDLRPRRIHYRSITNNTSRDVFRGYPTIRNPRYFRHSAFGGKFQRHDDTWYLEITPTYYFTWDGERQDRFYEDRLKGIKRLENNAAVLGQVVMWGTYLSRKDPLLPPYPFLEFDQLMPFEIECGISDEEWLPHEEEDKKEILTTDPTLF